MSPRWSPAIRSRSCVSMLYKVCELILESNIPLPELPPAGGADPQSTFHLLPVRQAEPAVSHWVYEWLLSSGEPWLSLARQERGYLLRFAALADFLLSSDGTEIRCHPEPDVPLTTIRHLLLDQVIPFAMTRRGRFVLHASAVVAPQGAIAFLGLTGHGKSTLAACLTQQGLPLLADDCLVLQEEDGRLWGFPSYPGFRLWPESVSALFDEERPLPEVAHYTEKVRLGSTGLCKQPAPLRRLYFLAPPEETGNAKAISITPVSPPEALISLLQSSFRLDITDRERLRDEFECLTRIAQLSLFYRLTYPRDFAFLPAVQEAILRDLGAVVPAVTTAE